MPLINNKPKKERQEANKTEFYRDKSKVFYLDQNYAKLTVRIWSKGDQLKNLVFEIQRDFLGYKLI